MIEKNIVLQSDFKKHLHTHPLEAHGIWARIKDYVPSFGYSKAEIDAFFESESGGKKQVDYTNVLNLAAGAIPYGTGATGLAGDTANIYYDAANQLLGVREASPTARVHINSVGGNVPALNLEAGAEGELVTPDGQQLRIGHWNGVDTFTERLRIDDAGKFYVSYLTTGSVLFAGANGEMKQDIDNFKFDIGNSRLGLNLGGGNPLDTLHLDGNLRLEGTSYSILANYMGAGREILTLRGKSTAADSAGINLYGDGDSTFPGQIKLFTNNITAMTIDAAQLITVVDLSVSTPVNVYNLSHDLFADYVAAKHYDWTNETHDFLTTGGMTGANLFLGVAPQIKWQSGILSFQTDEDDTDTYVNVYGKGTGYARMHLFDEDNAEYLRFRCYSGFGSIETLGALPLGLRFQHDTPVDITCWKSIPVGNPYFYIYGYQTDVGVKYGRQRVTSSGNFVIDAEVAGFLSQGGTSLLAWTSDFMRMMDNKTIRFGSGDDYSAGYHEPTDTLQVVDGATLNASVRVLLDPSGNIGLYGVSAFGDNAAGVLAMGNATAPTTSPADCFQMYSADIGGVAGKAGVHFRDEEGNIVSLGSGGILMTGTARVANDQFVGPNGIKAPGTKPATWIEHGISGVWQFADGDDETVVITYRVPHRMDRSVAPHVHVKWSTAGIGAGNCEWQLEYLWRAPGEDTTAIAQDTENITVAGSGVAANGLVVSNTLGLDLPSATDNILMVRLKRLAAGGNDTIADTVELHGVNLHFTSNKLGAAI